MDFSNRVVLITGSSKGIGKAIAFSFAKAGAHIILSGAHDEEALMQTYNECVERNFKVSYYLGDVSSFDICKKLFDFIHQATGSYPHIVINNVGISYTGLFTDTTPEIWHQIIRTNLDAAYHCSYLAVPHMIQKQQGHIINISSIWGNVGASCEVAYSTSKSALNGFTRALAKELGPSNIRVNAIACGWINTDMNKDFTDEEKLAFVEEVPLCRVGEPFEVANACLYLASSYSSYMTGQILTLDGGLL